MKRDATSKQNKSIPTKPRGWIKALRIIIYAVTIVGLAIGIGLIKSAALSSSFADGTYETRLSNGYAIFIPSVIVLTLNIFWGILRWFLRGHIEHWRASQVIGKLLGGGLWRTLLIVPLFLVPLFAITPLISDTIKSDLLAEAADFTPFDPDYATHRLEYINEHFDEFIQNKTADEIITETDELMMLNIDFTADEEEQPTNASFWPFTQNVYAATKNVAMLRKAKLSSLGHFIVFYTTTGKDAVTDADAENVGEALETIISNYEKNLGLRYEYEQFGVGVIKETNMIGILRENNLPLDTLTTAMPVYIVNPYSEPSSTIATYYGRKYTELVNDLILRLRSIPVLDKYFFEMSQDAIESDNFQKSAPSYPFISVQPSRVSSGDLSSVMAHEIGHHYVSLYNYAKYGSESANPAFIGETVANWLAVNVTDDIPTKGLMNGGHYNESYLKAGTSYTINEVKPSFRGYPAYAFLENYYEIIPNSETTILDATHSGNALAYLYQQTSPEQFQRVMQRLAERNLTGDYNGKLVNYIMPQGEELYCSDICDHTYTMAPASTQYLYFAPDEYQGTNVTFAGTDTIQASLLARTNEGWQVLSHASSEVTIDFTGTDYHRYPVVALAVSHSGIDAEGAYKISVVKSDLEDIVTEEGDYDFALPTGDILTDLGDNCYGVDVDRAFGYLNQFMSLGSELLGALSQHDASGSIANSKAEYDANMGVARENMNDARTALEGYKVSICLSYIAPGQSFESVRSRLERSLGSGFTFGEGQADSLRLSTIVSFNAFSRQAKAYVLGSDGSDMGLLTVNIEPK